MAQSVEPQAVLESPMDPTNSHSFRDTESDSGVGRDSKDSREVGENHESKREPDFETEKPGAGEKHQSNNVDPSSPASVSSLSSSDSTSKLISSLSINGIHPEKDQGQVRAITKKYEKYSKNRDPIPKKPEPRDTESESKEHERVVNGTFVNRNGIGNGNGSGNGSGIGSGTVNGPGNFDFETFETFDSGSSASSQKSSIVVSPVLPKAAARPVPPGMISKKPIKFTVRKVSRDEEVVPKQAELRKEYLYGNIPEHRAKLELRKASDKKSQLQQNQQKYDSYVVRSDKIEKEIRFLVNLLPPYNVEIDYATRNKITRAIEKLQLKKDEIDKKKYSLGISISRLWREYDENSTWVRSVSNQ